MSIVGGINDQDNFTCSVLASYLFNDDNVRFRYVQVCHFIMRNVVDHHAIKNYVSQYSNI